MASGLPQTRGQRSPDKIIEKVTEQEKLDAVLAESAWASPRIDITNKILKLLNK